MEGWKREKVSELCTMIVDCVNRTAPVVEEVTPYRMIRTTNIRGGSIDLTDTRYVDEETYLRWTRRADLKNGDVILTREAPIGEVGIINGHGPVFLGQRLMQYRADPDKIDPQFLYYSFLSSDLQHQFRTHEGSGSVVSHIRVADCHEFLVSYPSLPEQRAIASVLGALDDKIELNRRMNETVEAMARAIFRDWFVDFGPTRAKMEGRAPYLAPEIWSLFPDRLDIDGKPEGWRLGCASDIIEFNPSETLKKGEIAPYIDMAALPTTGAVAQPPVFREFSSGTKFRDGDTLFARITPCLENGKTAFVQQLGEGTVGWGSTEFIVMRSKEPVPPAVSYILARDDNFRAYAMQSMTGTSGRQRARTDAMKNYPVTMPPDEALWIRLSEFFASLFERIAVNADETRTLAETRDLLLPKLMSGEIRISDAEQIVEDVA